MSILLFYLLAIYYSQPVKKKLAGVAGFEPTECQSQSLVPYPLATPQDVSYGVDSRSRTDGLQSHNLAL